MSPSRHRGCQRQGASPRHKRGAGQSLNHVSPSPALNPVTNRPLTVPWSAAHRLRPACRLCFSACHRSWPSSPPVLGHTLAVAGVRGGDRLSWDGLVGLFARTFPGGRELVVTVSMRLMKAGDGVRYYFESVVAGDGDRSRATPWGSKRTYALREAGAWYGQVGGGGG